MSLSKFKYRKTSCIRQFSITPHWRACHRPYSYDFFFCECSFIYWICHNFLKWCWSRKKTAATDNESAAPKNRNRQLLPAPAPTKRKIQFIEEYFYNWINQLTPWSACWCWWFFLSIFFLWMGLWHYFLAWLFVNSSALACEHQKSGQTAGNHATLAIISQL